ncbi:MAG: branched-chain amino acid ABC transporter permease [Acidobacteria bacterium]|nr:branched-chain amino acid ABC transporter permease [Acidobacteriota bacterium]
MELFLQQLINGIVQGSIYALIALGYTMVYGVLRLINFAHGDVFMLGAFIGFYTANLLGISQPSVGALILVMTVSMAGSAAVGLVIERFAYRPVRKFSRLTSLITAIGVSLLLEYAAQFVFGATPKSFPTIFETQNISLFGNVTISNDSILIIIVSIFLMVMLNLIVFKTKLGKAMRAVSFNLDVAKLMGINTDFIIAFTFALGSALAAAAGILYSVHFTKIDPLMGLLIGLKAFVAAVLGGIGNITGAVLGGLLLGIAEIMVSGYISSSYKDVFAFLILILVLIVKPAGLLGSAAQEKV